VTGPDWRELRRQQGLDRLREQVGGDMIESADADDGLGPAAGHASTESYGPMPDDRTDLVVCDFCIRPARRLRLSAEGHRLCPACATLDQPDPKAPGYWTSLPIPVRRRRIIQHHGIDPLSWQPVAFALTDTTIHTDVDGLPSTVVARSPVRRVVWIGMPRSWWDVLRERGQGIATPGKRG
jgi:hypothetical protein